MTSLAEASRRSGWRGRLVWVALALSLTLNVFFIGGLVWVKTFMRPPSFSERLHAFGETLQLTGPQRQAFNQFIHQLRQHARAAREANQPLLAQIWTELAKPAPDNDLVTKLGAQVNDNRTAFQKEASSELLTFLKTLTPEQRAHIGEIVRSRHEEPARRLFQFIAP
jgi:uncharacterized membrane protein